ncbi:MAG TPA: hypothetical protein VF784_17155 [Anaerolineales bacterium]
MSKALGITLIAVSVLALAGGLFFAGTMFGRSFGFRPAADFHYGWNNSYGPGMMGRSGGFGMMGGRGGYGMMGGYAYNNATAPTLTVDQAKAAAQKYLAALNNSDLAIAEVMIFSNNAYVAVKETSTGRGAFELLVDPVSQVAYPEHGPNMMWNLKYGGLNHRYMMGGRGYGMMGGGYGGGMMGNWGYQSWNPADPSAAMPVTAGQAVQYAQKYLDANVAGAVAASDPMQFYGYYTLDFSRDGKVIGMLSVNGYSGQVFPHIWHGTFVEEAQ